MPSSQYSSYPNPDATLVHYPQLSSVLFRIHRGSEKLVRHLLLQLEPEVANTIALKLLGVSQKILPISRYDDPRLNVRVFGLNFTNPIGAAAGLDKNAKDVSAFLQCGFGFTEVGTVTPSPQPGNERPRVFRLARDHAIINRFGFNSSGADIVLRRLAVRGTEPGIVGVNIGPNKNTFDHNADYVRLVERFATVASYITINVSSPNTPGLRDLQQAAMLDDLLSRVMDTRERVAQNVDRTPLLLKIAPDLSLAGLDELIRIARSRRIDGMIVGNTTLSRPASLRDTKASSEAGGLSGRPLFPLATRMLAESYVRAEGAFPLIGLGGIDTGADALAKFRAGASLVQLCSGFVFRGLELIDEIKSTLVAALERERLDGLGEFIGTDAAAVNAEPWLW